MERLVNLFSGFDFEAGKCTLMHPRMLPDVSVQSFNLLTASNSFQWNELSVDLVYQANIVKKRAVVTLSF